MNMVSVNSNLKRKKEKIISTNPKNITKSIKKVKKDKTILKSIVHGSPTENSKMSKVKYVMPTVSVTDNLIDLSLNAIQKLAAYQSKKNTIFGAEINIFAEIRCVKIPSSRGNIKIFLPHSTVSTNGEVCLITPDLKKGKKIDHEPTIDYWKDILMEAGITQIKTILPLRQLKVEYDQFELKRRLLTQHDFIMVDTRVLNHTSHLLGKMFFKKHNMLIPIKLHEKHNIKKDIETGLRTVMMRLNEGHTSTVLIGQTSTPQEYLRENILALIQQLKKKYPGGEANIRSISLKLPLSLSVPLYLTLRSSNSIQTPKLVHSKPKHFTVLEDELSTIPNSFVRVAPDGTVHLKKKDNKQRLADEELTSNESEAEEDIEEENEMD